MLVINAPYWPEANGLYIQDNNLSPIHECGSRRIYRQINGTGFLWANTGDIWHRSTVICNSSLATTELIAYSNTQYTPIPSLANWGAAVAPDRMSTDPEGPSFYVADAPAGTCGI